MKRTKGGPGQVAQLVRASSSYAKVTGSIDRNKFKRQKKGEQTVHRKRCMEGLQTNEKILNIFTVREMQTKTTLKHQFSSIKITKIQKNKMVLHQGRGFDPAKPLLGNCCEVTT